MTPVDRRAILLYLCVAVALAFVDHRVRSDRHRHHVVSEYIPSVIDGTSGAPAKYRVLMPYALQAVAERSGADPYLVVLGSELLFILASLILMHAYLRFWYSAEASLAGTLAVAALLPLTFTNTWLHPDTFPDLALFTAGCLAVAARRDGWLMAILAIGMLNRETMGFLAVLWAVHRLPGDWRPVTLARGAAIFAVAGGVYVALRAVRGFEHYRMFMLDENLQMLKILPPGFDPYTRVAGYFWVVLLAVPAWLAWSGLRRPDAPRFFRSGFAVAALFLIVAWIFAAIIEVRVLVPALPLLLPGALHAFATLQRRAPSAPPPRNP
ncbi:MAG TPA: hypothetical protein VM364_14150 [Vicinamibacterales bacterium]|nr:hypothetical protein [Vicinamibacterales bacterium]